jgi:uncharacterized membrane protein
MLVTYLKAFGILLILDYVWISMIAQSLYQEKIGHLLAAEVNLPAAVVFYAIYIAGLLYFVLLDNRLQSRVQAAVRGAIFGFITYATYDFTNMATMRDWPLSMTVIDLAWGSFLCAFVSFIVFRPKH